MGQMLITEGFLSIRHYTLLHITTIITVNYQCNAIMRALNEINLYMYLGSEHIADLLIEAGSNVTSLNLWNQTPLYVAIQSSNSSY